MGRRPFLESESDFAAEGIVVFFADEAEFAFFHAFDDIGADADSFEGDDGVSDNLCHVADLPVTSFVQDDAEAGLEF